MDDAGASFHHEAHHGVGHGELALEENRYRSQRFVLVVQVGPLAVPIEVSTELCAICIFSWLTTA